MKIQPKQQELSDIQSSLSSDINMELAVPVFKGNSSLSRFFDDFKSFADFKKWSVEQRLALLPLSLSGIARDGQRGSPRSGPNSRDGQRGPRPPAQYAGNDTSMVYDNY